MTLKWKALALGTLAASIFWNPGAVGFTGAKQVVGPHKINPWIIAPPPPPIPSNLVGTTDVQVCSQHGGFGGGLACKALLPKGSLALVWNWSGKPDIAGFHVYRVDTASRQLVGSQPHNQTDGSVFTLFVVRDIPSDGFGGKCYAVTAYWAGTESSMSPEFCASGNSAIQTMLFTPKLWFSVSKTQDVQVYTQTYDTLPFMVSDSSTTVVIRNGLVQNTGPAIGNLAEKDLARTAILFDVSNLVGKRIVSARLRLTVDTAVDGDNASTDHYVSCVGKIGAAMDAGWQSYHDWIDATISASSIAQQGPEVAFDATSIVRQWARGDANYGFVLFGDADTNVPKPSVQDADWTGIDLDYYKSNCFTVYRPGSIQLEVQYQ